MSDMTNFTSGQRGAFSVRAEFLPLRNRSLGPLAASAPAEQQIVTAEEPLFGQGSRDGVIAL
jgi:hypothetical protein